jgi:hypothetical protein
MGILRVTCALAAAALLPAGLTGARALELRRDRGSPFDLAVTGRLTGLPPGETRYLRWSDLRALPVVRLRLRDEFVPGEQEVTVLYLEELWRALPRGPGADVLLATCRDGYASIYRQDFMARYRPFLVLEIDGHGPELWPPPGLKFNPGPYAISISPTVVPAVAALLDPGHKKPWGVVTLEVASFPERFHDAYSGDWGRLSLRAGQGREIWINSCASCHAGPGTIFGGSQSGQAFAVLATLAGCNAPFFRHYVRHPQELVPAAKMEGHPHYTDAQLDALIAFLTAGTHGPAQ